MKKNKYFMIIFFISILISTSGCGTGTQINETKEDVQEEIIPEKVYQDQEAKLIISNALEDVQTARRTLELIKNDQNSFLAKASSIESKIDIPNLRGDFTFTDINNMAGYIDIMEKNINGLSKSTQYYDSAIKYFNDVEKMDISPGYKAYVSKYHEAIIKEKNGVFHYQTAMNNKIKLFYAKTYIAFYILYMNVSNYYYGISASYYGNNEEILNNAIYNRNKAYDSIEMAYSYVPITQLSRSAKGTEVYEGLLTWEKNFVTSSLNLYEKSFNEAKILENEADKIINT